MNKKILKSIQLFLVSTLLLIVGIFTINSNNNKKSNAAMFPQYGANLDIKYYSDVQLQNEVSTVNPGDTVYIAVLLNDDGTLDYANFEFGWDASSAVSAGVTFAGLYTGTRNTDKAAIAAATGKSTSEAQTLWNTYIKPNGFADMCGPTISIHTPDSSDGKMSMAMATDSDTSIGDADTWAIVGLFQMNVPASVTSITMQKKNAKVGDYSYFSVVSDITVPMAASSDSVEVDTATVSSTNQTATNLTLSSTKAYKGTIPSSDSSANVVFTIKDGGKLTSVSDGTSTPYAASSPITVSLANPGDSKTLTIGVESKSGAKTETYTVTIERKKRDTKTLDSLTIANPSGTASGVMNPTWNNTFSSSTLTGYQVEYADVVTSLDVTPTATSGVGIKSVTVNGTTYSGSAISVPVSATSNTTLTVEVTAEDDSKQPYVITLKPKVSNTALSSVKLYGNGTVDLGNLTISGTSVTGSLSTTYTSYVIKINPTKSTNIVKVNGVDVTSTKESTPESFSGTTSTMTITIVDSDTGASKDYTVTIDPQKRGINTLSSITFTNPSGTASTIMSPVMVTAFNSTIYTGYQVKYDSKITQINVAPVATSGVGIQGIKINGTALTGSSMDVPVSGNTVTVTVIAENNNPQDYTFTLVPLTSNTNITSVQLLGNGLTTLTAPTVDNTAHTIKGTIPYSYSNFTIKVNPTKSGNKVYIDGTDTGTSYTSGITSVADPDTTMTVKIVDSETGAEETYTVTITRSAPSNAKDISTLELKYGSTIYTLTKTGDSYSNSGDKLPYNATTVTITATITGVKYDVTDDGVAGTANYNTGVPVTYTLQSTLDLSKSTFNVDITVFDEGTNQKKYDLEIVREGADGDSTLDTTSITFKDEDGNTYTPTFNSTTNTWEIELPYKADDLIIKPTVTKSTSTMTIDGTTAPSGYDRTINIGTSSTTGAIPSTDHQIKVTAQDTSSTTYTVKVSRKAAETTNTANAIQVDNVTKSTNDIATLQSDGVTYDLGELSYDTNELKITVSADGLLSTVKINNVAVTSSTRIFEYTYNMPADASAQTISIPVVITSESNDPKTYTISGTRKAASNTASATFTVSGNYTGTITPTVSGNTYTYVFGDNDTIASMVINPTDAKSVYYQADSLTPAGKISYTGGTVYPTIGDYSTGKTYYVQVVPEAGESYAVLYTLVFKAADSRNSDSSLAYLYAEDSNGITIPFEAPNTTYNSTVTSYDLKVPYTSDPITIYAIPTDTTGAAVYKNTAKGTAITTITVSSLTAGTAVPYHYIVQAENTSWGTDYVINVTRQNGTSVGEVDDILINNTSVPGFVKNVNGSYDVCLGRTVSIVDLTVRIGSTTFTPSAAGVTQDGIRVTSSSTGTNPMVFTVQAFPEVSSGVSHTYIVNVYKASQDYTITDFDILKAGTNIQQPGTSNSVYMYPATDFYLPYSIQNVTLDLRTDSYAKVTGSLTGTGNTTGLFALNNTGTTPNVVTITVKSEYATLNPAITDQETTFTVNIYREAPDNTNTITAFTSSHGTAGSTPNGDGTISGPLTVVSIPNTQSTISVTVTAKNPKSYVQIAINEGQDLTKATLGGETEAINVSTAGSVDSYTVYVWGEDTTAAPNTYVLKVTTADSINLDGDNTISNIKFYGNTITVSTEKTPDAANKITLTSKEISGKIDVAYASKATLKVTVGGVSTNYTGGSASITLPVAAGGSESITIQCIAEDPTVVGTPITYTFERDPLSQNSTATGISVNGNPVGNLTPNDTSTNVNTVVLPPNTTTASVSVSLPDGATADITSISGLNQGNNQRTVVVTAEDGVSTSTYTLNVYVMPQIKAADITVVGETMSPTFDPDTPNYDVHVTYDKDTVKIIVTLTNGSLYHVYIGNDNVEGTTKTITLASSTRGSSNKETIPVKIVALNSDGTESTDVAYQAIYKVIVERDEALSDNYLLDIKVNGQEVTGYNKTNNTYYIQVSRTTTTVSFTNSTDGATLNVSTGATYTIDGNSSLTAGALNDKTITVKSQGGIPNVYHFIIVPADTTVGFTDIELLTSASGTDLVDVTTTNAIVNYTPGDSYTNGNVAFSTQNAYLKVTAANANQKVKVNGLNVTLSSLRYGTLEALAIGANTFTVEAMSEYASLVDGTGATVPASQKLSPYTIVITRNNANSNPNLKTLEVSVGGVVIPFDLSSQNVDLTGKFIQDSGSSNLNIQNLTDATQIYIAATPMETTSVLSGDYNTTKTLQALSSSTAGYNFNFTITSTAEDGSSTATYTIVITRGPLNLDDDNNITGITLFDSNSATYVSPKAAGWSVEQWKEEVHSYPSVGTEITIPYGAQSVSFQVDKLAVSPATLVIKPSNAAQQSNTSGAFSFTIDNSFYGNTITYVIHAVSENGTAGTDYTFTLKFEAPSPDSSITVLTMDGTNVDGFSFAALITTGSNGTKNYTMTNVLPFSKKTITLYAEANDSNAVIAPGALGTFNLVEGVNSFSITVTAQDGSQSIYVVKVTRDFQTPYIVNMTLSDGKFVTSDGATKTTFDTENAGKDEQITNYTVKIPFTATQLTITTTTDNDTYTVTEAKSSKTVATTTQAMFKTPTISAGSSISFTFVVTSAESKTKSYTLTVKRATEAESDSSVGSIKIKEVTDFEKEYDENTFTYDTNTYKFTVEHKVDTLTVDVIPTAAIEGATSKIYGADSLTTGTNTIVIQTTSADKLTTTTYVVEVTRKPLEWDVNVKATDFETTENTHKVSYKVDMGNAKATDVKDWTKYITYDTTDETISVKCLSDINEDTNQVILEVTDGITTEYVTLNLAFSASLLQQLSTNWIIWAILAADIIILLAILVSVNRDKYGKVTKKRKEI